MLKITMLAAAAGLFAATAHATDARVFETPEAAVAAVIEALEDRDREALLAVFGSDAEDVVFTGETARDEDEWGGFLRSYRELHRLVVEGDGTATLYVGRDQWPFPGPLVQDADGWRFDAEAARDEIFNRRIGQNELDVIDLLRAYVEVQAEYRRTDWDGDGVMEFAAHLISTEGTRDGLYWPPAEEGAESPIGDFVARAAADGYSVAGADAEPEPYLGYVYRILDAQGPAAPGGAYAYVLNGNMVAGHALLAFPAVYQETGIMSFLVGENGLIFEADLADETLDRAFAIEAFDPGEGWTAVD